MMEHVTIDIHKLPIPDWDIRCPRCGYILNGLPDHRCPECGLLFKMEEAVASWARLRAPRYDGRELPFPDFGLRCASCRSPLAGATSLACPSCRCPFDPAKFKPKGEWIRITAVLAGPATVASVVMVLQREQVPHIYEERVDPFAAGGRPTLSVASEFYFELLWLLHHTIVTTRQAGVEGEEDTWQCRGCNEQNPVHFELCWNCGAGQS